MSLFWIAKAPGSYDWGGLSDPYPSSVAPVHGSTTASLTSSYTLAATPAAASPDASDADALSDDVLGDFPIAAMASLFALFGTSAALLICYWVFRRRAGRIEIAKRRARAAAATARGAAAAASGGDLERFAGGADGKAESESSETERRSTASDGGGAGFGQGVNSAVRTATHILTTYVGVGVFSIPFCFAQAGWAALLVLFAVVSLAAYTGTLLGASCRTLDVAAPSYPMLAQRCLGETSKRVVQLSIIALLLVFQVAVQLTTWEHAYLLLPGKEHRWVAVLACLFLSFLMVWVSNAERLAKSSALGLLCIAIICVLMGCKLVDHDTPPPPRTLIRPDGIPMCLAILMTSVAGHVALPPLLVAMKKPEDFRRTLIGSFSTIFVIYAFIGVSGYMLFGDDAAVVVNINIRAAMHSTAGEVLAQAIAAGIALKCLCTEPLLGLLVVDLAEKVERPLPPPGLTLPHHTPTLHRPYPRP